MSAGPGRAYRSGVGVTTGQAVGRLAAEKAAEAAWARYASACRWGGTRAEQRNAFQAALKAEAKLALVQPRVNKRLAKAS